MTERETEDGTERASQTAGRREAGTNLPEPIAGAEHAFATGTTEATPWIATGLVGIVVLVAVAIVLLIATLAGILS